MNLNIKVETRIDANVDRLTNRQMEGRTKNQISGYIAPC